MGTAKAKGSLPINVLKGALIGAAVSVALVAAFAFVLLKQWLSAESIPYVNVGIKAVSAAAAALAAAAGERRALKGALAGVLYTLVSFAVFSLISGRFELDAALLSDIAICGAVGAVTGMMRNLRG